MKALRRCARIPWAFALAGAALALFRSVGAYDFVMFDDGLHVFGNSRVLAGVSRSGTAWAFSTWETGNWHPLTWLSLMLDVELFGGGAGPMHLTNLALHAANGAGLFLVLERLTGALLPSVLAAFLFLFHPLHVESMAWVSERKDVLSTLFGVLALAAYAGYARRPRASRYVPVLIAFGLGLMAKSMLVSLPFVLLLLDYWPLGRGGGDRPGWRAWKRLVAEKAPLFALSTAASLVAWRAQASSGAVWPESQIGIGLRIGNAVLAYARYLGKTLWPSRLSFFYPHPGGAISWPAVAASGVLAVLVSLWALRTRRSRPWMAVGWCWYLGTLVPVIGLVQVGSQGWADRYTYVPLIGVFIAFAWGAAAFARRRGAASVAAALLLAPCAALLMAAAHRQAGFWRDGGTIGARSVDLTPGSWVGWQELGLYNQRHGNGEAALRFLERARQLAPGNHSVLYNLGWVHDAAGRYEEAVRRYREALALDPGDVSARTNLGVALSRLGRHREAVPELERASSARPGSETVRRGLAFALARAGEPAQAEREYRRALLIDPEYGLAHHELGCLLLEQGRADEAEVALVRALRQSPDDPDLRFNLGVVAQARGRGEEAQARYREALGLSPDFPEAWNNLGVVLLRAGRSAEAVVAFNQAARLRPEDDHYRANLEKARSSPGKSP